MQNADTVLLPRFKIYLKSWLLRCKGDVAPLIVPAKFNQHGYMHRRIINTELNIILILILKVFSSVPIN